MLHFLDVFDIGYIGYVLFFELLPLGCWIWIWGPRHPSSCEYKGDENEIAEFNQ